MHEVDPIPPMETLQTESHSHRTQNSVVNTSSTNNCWCAFPVPFSSHSFPLLVGSRRPAPKPLRPWQLPPELCSQYKCKTNTVCNTKHTDLYAKHTTIISTTQHLWIQQPKASKQTFKCLEKGIYRIFCMELVPLLGEILYLNKYPQWMLAVRQYCEMLGLN